MPPADPIFEIVDDAVPPRNRHRANARLQRLRFMAWLLDSAFSAGGTRRFGLEPLIGLVPGLGDWIGGLLSLYVVYEAARLGLPWRVIGLMGLNVAIETLVGTIPVAGDIFDFLWRTNIRNLRLVERHYTPEARERPLGRIVAMVLIAIFLLFLSTIVFGVLIALGIWHLFRG